ncbi:helix-turn-helix transcriptional regulator [Paenibacillus sp. PL2-23]|uniref:helix-turn-helix domain-containing protein n=1 Tax=Paenibacillus sp. PL2-23 TaxID=2100729 RepID=UPI0030FB9756
MEFKYMVGEQIRRVRKLRGMTQEQLAEQSGLSFSYVSDVERGTRNISLESLEKIINALGVRPNQLFEEIDVLSDAYNDGARNKIEELNTLLSDRQIEDVDFILKIAREFLITIDRKNR